MGFLAIAISKDRHGFEQMYKVDINHALLNRLGVLLVGRQRKWLCGSLKMMGEVRRWDFGPRAP
ncbi:hypothetical protein HDV62DRAFT_359187 [Trichoderma sp. SZMC 28011]